MNATPSYRTPLQYAAESDAAWAVDLLLAKGADVVARDKEGWTALHHACDHANTAAARLLLDHKAPVKRKGGDGTTPLHLAVSVDKPDKALVALLLKHSGPVRERGEQRRGHRAAPSLGPRRPAGDRRPAAGGRAGACGRRTRSARRRFTSPHGRGTRGGPALLKLGPDLWVSAKNPNNSTFASDFGSGLTPYQMARLHHHREAADLIDAAEKAAEEKGAGEKAK